MSDGQVIFDIRGNQTNLDADLDRATDAIARKTAGWTALAQTAANGIMNLTGKALRGFGELVKNSISYNASMQDYVTNFGTLLGSAEAAEKKVAELKQYAVKTPFAMSNLAQATQTMLSFGLSGEEASLHLERLGDISMGDAQKLQSLTLAFSQVSSSGKLAGQDLLQMINAGFNPLQTIAQKTGVTIGDLKAVMSGDQTSEDFNFRMEEARREVEELGVNASEGAIMLAKIGEEGMISADMVAAAMRIATSEGGLFYGALENASQNFNAQLSTLQDGLSTLSGNVFSELFDYLSVNVMPTANRWVSELNDAYEKDGWEGLKTAAGGIFDEIGVMAANTGAGILAELYNGLTGDTATAEEIKGYIASIFTSASEAASGILFFIGAAMALMGHPLAGIALMLGVIITDWETIKTTVGNVLTVVYELIEAVGTLMGIKSNDQVIVARETYVAEATAAQEAEAAQRAPSKYAGKYAHLAEDVRDEMLWYVSEAIKKGSQNGIGPIDYDLLTPELLQSLRADVTDALNSEEFTIEIAETWFTDVQSDLQSQLNGVRLSVRVYPNLASVAREGYARPTGGLLDSIINHTAGLVGQTHASGGIYTGATRLMGADGLHTVGESGSEAIVPLDELWRRLGLTFDAAFAANLSDLPLTVLPRLAAAAPAPAAASPLSHDGTEDYDRMAEVIAERVAQAISGLSIEMKHKKVAEILSREIAEESTRRRWTG